MALYWSSCAEL